MQKNTIDIDDLRVILSDEFLTEKRIKELRKKLEAIQQETNDYLDTLKYLEKLQSIKTKFSN
jgi:hypothetical protein